MAHDDGFIPWERETRWKVASRRRKFQRRFHSFVFHLKWFEEWDDGLPSNPRGRKKERKRGREKDREKEGKKEIPAFGTDYNLPNKMLPFYNHGMMRRLQLMLMMKDQDFNPKQNNAWKEWQFLASLFLFSPTFFFIPLFTHLLLRWNFILLELSITSPSLSLSLGRNRIWTVNTWIEMFQVEEKETCQKSCSSRSPVAPFFLTWSIMIVHWKKVKDTWPTLVCIWKDDVRLFHSKPTTIPHTLPNSNELTFQAVPLGLVQDENDENKRDVPLGLIQDENDEMFR